MRDVIAEKERHIIHTVLNAICVAPHSKRIRMFKQAYRESIQEGYTGWAILCHGFELLLEERYEFFNDTLWENLENHSFDGEARGQYFAYYSLRPLLFAHAHRRLADQAINDYKKNLYEDKGELRQRIDWAIDRATELYSMITDRKPGEQDKRIRAVAYHGMAKLAYLKIRYKKIFEHNQEIPFRFSDKLCEAKQFYSYSISIAEQEGFDYAPPLNGIAWLNWIEFRENKNEWNDNQRLVRLHQCQDLLNRSISASKEEKNETYAPPILLRAVVSFRLGIETGEKLERKVTAEEISKAIRISPYDSMVQEELDVFSQALRDDAEDGLADHNFYRAVRIALPAVATKASLNQYLAEESWSGNAKHKNQLLILRRWSSYTPLIRLREHATVGGGYLLEWGSTQLAIDPGVGFVRNLYQYGYRVQDLDAVIITHQHIDHADDTEAILSILKTCVKETLINKGLPKFLLTKSGLERWEKMIVSALDLKSSKPLIGELLPKVDRSRSTRIGDIEVLPVPLHGHPDAIDEAPELNKNGEPMPKRPPTGCGLVLKLLKGDNEQCTVGITSDTGYISSNGIDDKPIVRASDYYRDCDVVVLHISMVEDCDERYVLRQKTKGYFAYPCTWAEEFGYSGLLYEKHLGFWGVVLFIRDLLIETGRSDRIFVLSEFGEETLKNRIPILNEICRLIEALGNIGKEQARRIHLGDVGTQIRLPEGSIGCNFGINGCPKIADRFLEFDAISGDLSLPHRGWNDRALAHFCSEHDYIIGNPHALNPAFWGYFGRPVINNELREARLRSVGDVYKNMFNYWL